MERTGQEWACERCGKLIRWGLVLCIVCGRETGKNVSRAEKVIARRSIRPYGAKGW